jgi:hypothetical protein
MPGELKCASSPCVTVVFNNISETPQNIKGTLKAKLTGAARLLDNKFNFSRIFPVGKTSCHIPTETIGHFAKHVNVSLQTDAGAQCTAFMPKGTIQSNSGIEALIGERSCMIQPFH